jgi:hypothetical protein
MVARSFGECKNRSFEQMFDKTPHENLSSSPSKIQITIIISMMAITQHIRTHASITAPIGAGSPVDVVKRPCANGAQKVIMYTEMKIDDTHDNLERYKRLINLTK